MRTFSVFLIFSYFTNPTWCFQDPGIDLMTCIDGGQDLNACAEKTLEGFRKTMDTGLPELGLPPIDPMHLELIDFNFYNLTVEFFDLNMFGFKGFSLKSSNVDKKKRTWDIKLSLPKINAVGMYKMFGTIPPGLDLGLSTGDERFSADSVDAFARLTLGAQGNQITVTGLDLSIRAWMKSTWSWNACSLRMVPAAPRNTSSLAMLTLLKRLKSSTVMGRTL
eukprot:TRINITY_DN12249_c0_g1_i1.p1 TRINITY_DN12249_c0_g1~~TRINITY_DN12249_c0_g1_i1.p1  ORF type:complete len:221 (-),score=32.53 TRINITY_DN12249_c0_g1_i1:189-851(-)